MTPIQYTWPNGSQVRFEVEAVLLGEKEVVLIGYDHQHKKLHSLCVVDKAGDPDTCFWYEGHGASYEFYREVIDSRDGTYFENYTDDDESIGNEHGYVKCDVTGNLAGKLNYIENYTMIHGQMEYIRGEAMFMQPTGKEIREVPPPGIRPASPTGKVMGYRRMNNNEFEKFKFLA